MTENQLVEMVALAIKTGRANHVTSVCGCMGPSPFAVEKGQLDWCYCSESTDQSSATQVLAYLRAIGVAV